MKLLLSFLFLTSVYFGKCQTWPETDSQWNYCYNVDNLNTLGPTIFEYTNDSLINDTSYAIVRPTLWINNPSTYQDALNNNRVFLFRQSNDTIFRRVGQAEFIFYIQGIEVGESFTTFRSSILFPNISSCQNDMVLEIVEISEEEINGEIYQFVKMEDVFFDEVYSVTTFGPRYFTFIEGIGLQANFPYFNNNAIMGTLCYDFVDGNINSDLIEYNGEELSSFHVCIPNSTSNEFDKSFDLFPNPVEKYLEWNKEVEKITLINSLGKTVFEKTLDGGMKRIELPNLPNGLYTAVFTNGNDSAVKKLIIQKR